MYKQFFNLSQAPFSIAPDPRYLYMSERHREALAHLLYGVGSGGGFVLLTGEIGAGKTTVCRCFLEQIPENCRVAYIFNPKLSVEELLKTVCDEFGIDSPMPGSQGAPSVKDYVDVLNAYLLAGHASGQNNVLIIDEAQNLSAPVLEQLRLLTNLETNVRKLLQIILIGQPELRAMLARPELEQLAQRVIARYHLGPLSAVETAAYVLHRLGVASANGTANAGRAFPSHVFEHIFQLTAGVPRRINLLCDRAMLGAYAESRHELDRGIISKAAAEVFGPERAPLAGKTRVWPYLAAGLLAGAALSAGVGWRYVASNPVHAGAPQGKELPKASSPGPSRAMAVAQASANSVPAMAEAAVSAKAKLAASAIADAVPSPASDPATAALAAYRESSQTLAQFWGKPLSEGDVCEAAKKRHLRCYYGSGGLAELTFLNRPALLTLDDGNGKTHHALLTGLDKTSATLGVGANAKSIALAELNARFKGEFMTFWRLPRGFRNEVAEGMHGIDVDWLAEQLALWSGGKKPPANQVFAQPLARQVRDFQNLQKLKVDEVVGPQTFMRLSVLASVDEPSLSGANSLGGKDGNGVIGNKAAGDRPAASPASPARGK